VIGVSALTLKSLVVDEERMSPAGDWCQCFDAQESSVDEERTSPVDDWYQCFDTVACVNVCPVYACDSYHQILYFLLMILAWYLYFSSPTFPDLQL